MKKAILIVISIFLIYNLGRAQENSVFTLKQCIGLAIANNPDVKRAKINLAQNESAFKTQKLSFLPTANISGSHAYNFGRSLDRYSNQFTNTTIRNNFFSLNSNFTIYNGLQNQNNLNAKKYAVEASENAMEVALNNVVLQVSNSFLQYKMSEENIALVENQLKQTKLQLERVKKLYEACSIDQGQVFSLEAQIANDELNLTNVNNSMQSAMLSLRSLMQLPLENKFELIFEDSLQISPLLVSDVDLIYSNALATMPQIAQAEAQLKSAGMSYQLAKGARAPSVSAYATVSTVYSGNAKDVVGKINGLQTIGVVESTLQEVVAPKIDYQVNDIKFAEQAKSNFGQQVGVQANIPLFNGNQVNNAILNAETNYELTQLNLETAKQQLYNDIANAVNNANAAYAKLEAAQKSNNAQKTSMDFADKKYTAGLLNYYDYNNARNLYLNSLNTLQSAKYEYIFKKMIVEFYQDNSWKF